MVAVQEVFRLMWKGLLLEELDFPVEKCSFRGTVRKPEKKKKIDATINRKRRRIESCAKPGPNRNASGRVDEIARELRPRATVQLNSH